MINSTRTHNTSPHRLVAVVALLGLALGACGGGDSSSDARSGDAVANTDSEQVIDRAGNTLEPVTLTLGTNEHDAVSDGVIEALVSAVSDATDGLVTIEPTVGIVDEGTQIAQRAIQRVKDGDFDIVLTRAAAWDSFGVSTLEALQLPDLVSTDAQADSVATDPAARDALLSGLGGAGFTGLGLYPGESRFLFLLDGTTDFSPNALRGRLLRTLVGEGLFESIAALGITPVDLHYDDWITQVSEGSITAGEGGFVRAALTPTNTGLPIVVAGNLTVYTRFLVAAISDDALGRLDPALADRVRQAATDSIQSYVDGRSHTEDDLATACAAGVVVVDIPDEARTALIESVRPARDGVAAGPGADALAAVEAAAGDAEATHWACPGNAVPTPTTAASAATDPETVPTKRSEIVPEAGELPGGIYRAQSTIEALEASDAAGGPFTDEDTAEYLEFHLHDGQVGIQFFLPDGTPEGEEMVAGGVYHVEGDTIVMAVPPGYTMPGTNGINLLRWHLDGDTLTFEQLDDRPIDWIYLVPWTRVADLP